MMSRGLQWALLGLVCAGTASAQNGPPKELSKPGLKIIAGAWSPDGKRIATSHEGRQEGLLCFWDAGTGALIGETPLASACYDVAFDPTGKWIATLGVVMVEKRVPGQPKPIPDRAYGVALRDPKSGKLIRLLECGENLWRFVFSPDGSRIATANRNDLNLWDSSSGKLLRTMKGHAEEITCLDYSRDGRFIVTGSKDMNVHAWSADNGKLTQTFKRHTKANAFLRAEVSAVRIRADGKTVISASSRDTRTDPEGSEGTIYVWKIGKDDAEPMALKGHSGGTDVVDISKDDRTLLTYSVADNVVRYWNPDTGEETGTQGLGRQNSRFVRISPDGKRLIAGGLDEVLHLWDVGGKAPIARAPSSIPALLAVRPDGTYATAGTDRVVRLWDPSKSDPVRKLEGAADAIVSLACSGDGKRIVAGLQDGGLVVWDAETGAAQPVPGKQSASASPLIFLPDGKRLAVGDGSKVRLLDAATGKVLRVLDGHEATVVSLSPYAGGTKLAALARGGAVSVWDLEPEGPRQALGVLVEEAVSLSASDDGEAFAFGGKEAKVQDRQPRGGLHSLTESGRSTALHTPVAVFSPDGRWIVCGHTDGTVLLWNRRNRRLAEVFKGHSTAIAAVAFAGSPLKVLISAQDGSLRTWSPAAAAAPPAIGHDEYAIESMAAGGSWLVTTNAGEIKLWDLTQRGKCIVLENSKGFRRVALRLEEREVVAAGNPKSDGAAWSMDTGKRVRTFGARGLVPHLSADGKWLAVQENVGWSAWSLEPGVETGKSPVNSLVAISGNGTRVLTTETQKVRVFDVQGAKEIRAIDQKGYGQVSAISPDGSKVALALTTGEVVIVEVSSGKARTLTLGTQEGMGSSISRMSFSPDGKRLAAETHKLLRLCSLNDGKVVFTKRLEEGSSRAFCWGTDGRTYFCSSSQVVEIVEIPQ